MSYYLSILALATGLAHLSRVSTISPSRFIYLALTIIVLVGFAGFRGQSVGTDTPAYVRIFTDYHRIAHLSGFNMEIGYVALVQLARALSKDYSVLLLISSLPVVVTYILGIRNFVNKFEIGVYLFIALGLFAFSLNGMRQAIAMGICFWALPFVFQRKFIPYLCAVAVAFLFHRTAIAALPIYFLASKNLDFKQYMIIASTILVGLSFLAFITEIAAATFGERFSYYQQEAERGGVVTTLFLTAQGMVFIAIRNLMGNNKIFFTRCLNIYLIGLVPAWLTVILSLPPSGIMRLHFYYTCLAIVLWPIALDSVRDRRMRAMLSLGLLYVPVVYFVATTSAFSNLIPYEFSIK